MGTTPQGNISLLELSLGGLTKLRYVLQPNLSTRISESFEIL